MNNLTCLDLFSGAGGLSEGFLQTGYFEFLGHVEWEKPMVDTLRNSLEKRWGYSKSDAKSHVVQFDIQKTEELMKGNWSDTTKEMYEKNNSSIIVEKGLDGIIQNRKVDVIIGGPPCQAYSLAGRAQDPQSMKNDYRNYLFESFVKVVDYYKPKVFVFENVPGILSAKPGDRLVIERIFEAFENIGYYIRKPEDMTKSIYSSVDYEVPQDRKRVIIFGVKKDYDKTVEDFYNNLNLLKSNSPKKTVKDAIYGLPEFRPLAVPFKNGSHNVSHELIGKSDVTQHEARYHNKRDIKVFYDWISKSMNNLPNDEKLKYYEKVTGKKTNHNKYRSLEWDKPSPTIVSHLYKDGLMFIHPDINQLRSITVREAALIQTFPIDFEFIGSNAYCYKMIGNAVPVLFAKSIALAVMKTIGESK